MTELDSLRRNLWGTTIATIAAAGTLVVPVIVASAIIWARFAYASRHPDASVDTYLTISRAISDPVIGEPFAVWITATAGPLWLVTHMILAMLVLQHPNLSTGRARSARFLFSLISLAMTAACVGMVMLSRWRLGAGDAEHDLHMLGSYVFFVGQTLTILLAAVYHSWIVEAPLPVEGRRFFSVQSRARYGYLVSGAALLYGGLFWIKDADLGSATHAIIRIYVETETLLIIAFLAYLAAYSVDVFNFWRRVQAVPHLGADIRQCRE